MALLFIAMLNCTAVANDAPVTLISGGATPVYGPIRNQEIRMMREVVQVTLSDKSYVVDGTFEFYNTGKTTDVEVGFPKRGFGYLDGRFSNASDFIRFETWVDDKKVAFSEKPDKSSIEGAYFLPELIKAIKSDHIESAGLSAKDFRWMVKRVNFPANQKTTTRVLYEAPYQDSGSNCSLAYYIYGTGTYWSGKIGKFKFIVDGTRLPAEDGPYEAFSSELIKKYKITRTVIRKGLIKYEINTFKPSKDEEITVPIRCRY
jgi:hypothetical protein